MDRNEGGGNESSADIISYALSHLLTDPPLPPSLLHQTVRLIIDRNLFVSIESNSSVLQKWNTRMSSLLQSKNIESRYWGVCLVKATISNGGEGINHAIVWAKLLASLLNRPESPIVLERAIAALEECFLSVGNHPGLSRDANALLPGYFSSVLNLASQPTLLPACLKALHALIPDHSNTFRPSLASTNSLLLSTFSSNYPSQVKSLAARVYVQLHHSASKGTNSEYWRSSVLGIISEGHMVLNNLFDCLEEDGSRVALTSKGIGLPDEASLPSAIERLDTLTIILQEFLTLPTKHPVNVPFGHVVDLAQRIYAVDSSSRPRDGARKQNFQAVIANLPHMYATMNSLLSTTLRCVEQSFLPHFRSTLRILSHLILSRESSTFKSSAYGLVSQLVGHFGSGLHSPREGKLLESLVKTALADIGTLSTTTLVPSLSTSSKSRKRKHNSNQPFEPQKSRASPTTQITCAIQLVTEILRLTPLLSLSIRSSIDQVLLSTALKTNIDDGIVCALHQAIVTSIQHPVGIAVLPQAIRILNRDLSAAVAIVRQSAVKHLRDLELIIHPKMPPRTSTVEPVPLNEDEMDGMMDHDQDDQEARVQIEEPITLTRTAVEPSIVYESPRVSKEPVPTAAQPEPQRPSLRPPLLPSFVTNSSVRMERAGVSAPSQPENAELGETGNQPVVDPLEISRLQMTEADVNRTEIPEIDMGFDSDEE